MKNNSPIPANDENKDPQMDAGLARLICTEKMPSMVEVMRIGMPYPYKRTYCGIELEYDPSVVEDNMQFRCGSGCECDTGKNCVFSPCDAVGRARARTPGPEDRDGSEAGDIVPDSQPCTPKPSPADARLARLVLSPLVSAPGDAGAQVGEAVVKPEDWNSSDVFVMRADGSPIRLRHFSPVRRSLTRAASEAPDDLVLPPPSKVARTGSCEPRSLAQAFESRSMSLARAAPGDEA